MKPQLIPSATCLFVLAACAEKEAPHQPPPATQKSPADHGLALQLGTLSVGSRRFEITQLGRLVPGEEGAFEVMPKGNTAAEIASLNVYLWIESEDGTQLSAPAKGTREGTSLHFHATPQKAGKAPFRVVLRVRADGADDRASLPLDGHGHEHAHGPHGGVIARFAGAGTNGHLELKLHDDKGDLELWLGKDDKLTESFDLPLAATVEVEFIDVKGRKVSLRARNQTKNEDEDGKPNVRAGRTNYFVYPGASGEDSAWLRGKEFQSIVIVRFQAGETAFVSEELVLKPHVH